MKKTIYLQSPVSTRSGYGAHAREIALALLELADYDVKFISLPWGNTPMTALDEPKYAEIKRRIIFGEVPKPDIFIQLSIPNEFQPLGNYNIGITAGIETDVCSPEWIEGMNRMNEVIVTSEHSKLVFDNVSYDKVDNNTKQVIDKLKVNVPMTVLFEGCDVDIYKSITRAELNKDVSAEIDSIPEKFVFLSVGHWLQGELGADRKDLGMLVKTFIETFKNEPKESRPALLLKTSGATFSIIDREDIMRKITFIMDSYPDSPNVYLLHGDLSDTEMNSLYNHPKIKAMVSFTHGEGFGRPFLEFSMVGKPIMAPDWSGHKDFLSKNFVTLLPGELKPVSKSATNQWILENSRWFVVNYPYASGIMKHMYFNYDSYLDKAQKQKQYALANFTMERMNAEVKRIIDTVGSRIPQRVQLQLPSLKKVEQPKKIELPKLKKIENV